MITKLLLPQPTKKRVIFSAVCRKKNFGPTKNNNKPTTLNCEFPYFHPYCSWFGEKNNYKTAKKKKKLQVIHFRKNQIQKSIISIMKKQEKLLHSSEKKRKKEKKDTIKTTQAYYQTKKSVIKFDQVWTGSSKSKQDLASQFFLLHVYMQLLWKWKKNTVC